MPTATVALVGNPNAGKSTLFNALSGLRQHVGNYPGVTVDLKTGHFSHAGTDFTLVDLPGTYSLAPRSPDELVTVDLLLGNRPELKPDAVLAVVDASNLDRHLYLTTQAMELGVPVVLALNMTDVAEAQGVKIDCGALAKATGLTVVPVQANRGVGLPKLRDALHACLGSPAPTPPAMPEAVEVETEALAGAAGLSAVIARRTLFDIGGGAELALVAREPSWGPVVTEARRRLAAAGCAPPGVEARTRYAWIRKATARSVKRPDVRVVTASDRVDRVLTHRVWGTLFFLLVMFGVFQAIFVWAKPAMEVIDSGRGLAAELVSSHMDDGPLRSLVADGMIKGVGAVLVFLPQILILFLFIAVLEDCGYMARAAFLMDRVMSRCGLNGKSFIPLLSSVACAVPGIMATRVIEDRRDRIATMVVAPLMSCSARLPVYALFIAAFLRDGFPWWLPGVVLFGMYLIGFVTAPVVALVLKRTLLRGETPLFVMELPAYKRPALRTVLTRMFDAGWAFVRRAGTVILATMVLIWASLYFPYTGLAGVSYPARVAELAAIEESETATDADKEAAALERAKVQGEWQRGSLLGRCGRAAEPAFRPLGWDWKIGMAAIASFPAREVFVGTFGLLYDQGEIDAGSVGDDADPQAKSLKDAVRGEWLADPVRGPYAVPVALSVLVFIALCCQCVSTLAVIRRETRGWAWPLLTFTYMTTLAYVGALVTFQVGKLVVDSLAQGG